MSSLSKEAKLKLAQEITTAYVRNEAVNPTPESAAEMLKTIFNTMEELLPAKDTERKIGLGV